MKEIEAGINNPSFRRVHKSYIVNIDKIVSIERGMVILKPKIEINIGLTYKESFLEEVKLRTVNSGRL